MERARRVERARQSRAARVQNVLSSLTGLTQGGSEDNAAGAASVLDSVSPPPARRAYNARELTPRADGLWSGHSQQSKRSAAAAAAAAAVLGIDMPEPITLEKHQASGKNWILALFDSSLWSGAWHTLLSHRFTDWDLVAAH